MLLKFLFKNAQLHSKKKPVYILVRLMANSPANDNLQRAIFYPTQPFKSNERATPVCG